MASTAGSPPDPIYVFCGFKEGVSAVSFVELKGKHHLLTGDSSGEMALWDLTTRKRWWHHQEEKALTQPSILACGSWSRGFWAHARGRCVRFWSMDDGNGIVEICCLPCSHVGFCGASVLTDSASDGVTISDLVALPLDNDGQYAIEIHEISETGSAHFSAISLRSDSESHPTGSPMTCLLTRFPSSKTASAISMLIIGFESGLIQIWQVVQKTPQLITEEQLLRESILGMDFLPGRRFGVCVSPDKMVSCWHMVDDATVTARLCIRKQDDILLPKAGASAVRIRDDGKIFAVGGWDGKIRVFATKTLNPLAVLQFHSETVRCLCFSHGKANGLKLMAVGSKDGSVTLWSLYSS